MLERLVKAAKASAAVRETQKHFRELTFMGFRLFQVASPKK